MRRALKTSRRWTGTIRPMRHATAWSHVLQGAGGAGQRSEDIEKRAGDDAAGAARHGWKSRFAGRSGREQLPLEHRLAALVVSDDPTVRAIQARKAQLEESRRAQPISFLRRRR